MLANYYDDERVNLSIIERSLGVKLLFSHEMMTSQVAIMYNFTYWNMNIYSYAEQRLPYIFDLFIKFIDPLPYLPGHDYRISEVVTGVIF